MQISDTIDYDDLVALVDALDYLKKDAQQKMSIRRASQSSMQTHLRPACVGGANQGVRRSSRRIVSAPQYASTGSLFVSEDETESESSSQNDGIQSPILCEENHDENETRNTAAEILINHPTLLHVDNDS